MDHLPVAKAQARGHHDDEFLQLSQPVDLPQETQKTWRQIRATRDHLMVLWWTLEATNWWVGMFAIFCYGLSLCQVVWACMMFVNIYMSLNLKFTGPRVQYMAASPSSSARNQLIQLLEFLGQPNLFVSWQPASLSWQLPQWNSEWTPHLPWHWIGRVWRGGANRPVVPLVCHQLVLLGDHSAYLIFVFFYTYIDVICAPTKRVPKPWLCDYDCTPRSHEQTDSFLCYEL